MCSESSGDLVKIQTLTQEAGVGAQDSQLLMCSQLVPMLISLGSLVGSGLLGLVLTLSCLANSANHQQYHNGCNL